MRTKIIVELEIEHGPEEDPFHVVDTVLDAGVFQDSINEHDAEDVGPMRVKSATCRADKPDPIDDKPDPIDDFLKADAAAQLNTKHDAALTEIEEAHVSGRIGISNALARAYVLGAHRRESLSPLLADLARAVETNEADHARKRGTKIRESFLASVRANTNLLASMTADERKRALRYEHNGIRFHEPNDFARAEARALMVETWGQEAVDAALGGA